MYDRFGMTVMCSSCANRNRYLCQDCIGWDKYRNVYGYKNMLPDVSKELKMLEEFAKKEMEKKESMNRKINMRIKKVVFNNPVTVVIWEDNTKTIVRAQDGEKFDPEKGLAMAIVKHIYGGKGKYYDIFKKWIPEEDR